MSGHKIGSNGHLHSAKYRRRHLAYQKIIFFSIFSAFLLPCLVSDIQKTFLWRRKKVFLIFYFMHDQLRNRFCYTYLLQFPLCVVKIMKAPWLKQYSVFHFWATKSILLPQSPTTLHLYWVLYDQQDEEKNVAREGKTFWPILGKHDVARTHTKRPPLPFPGKEGG